MSDSGDIGPLTYFDAEPFDSNDLPQATTGWEGVINPDYMNGPAFTEAQLDEVRNSPEMAALGVDLTQPPPDFLAGTGLTADHANFDFGAWNKAMAMPTPDVSGGPDTNALSKGDYHAAMPDVTAASANPDIAANNAGPDGENSVADGTFHSGTASPADVTAELESSLSPASGGASTGSAGTAGRAQGAGVTGQPWLNQRDQAFFDQQYPPASKVAKQLGVDPSLLLGVAAEESGYGTQLAGANNPFGATPHGDSTRGLDYPSFDAAWQKWGNDWGRRVKGLGGDKTAFLNALQQDNRGVPGTDGRGRYNPGDAQGGDSDWTKKVGPTIDGVRKRLPNWM